jgi:hypothetical protein
MKVKGKCPIPLGEPSGKNYGGCEFIRYAPETMPGFRMYYSHSRQPSPTVERDTCYFYCNITLAVRRYGIVDICTGSHKIAGVHDFPERCYVEERSDGYDAILFMGGRDAGFNLRLGYYVPEINVFYGCDLTHSPSGLAQAEEIMAWLRENGMAPNYEETATDKAEEKREITVTLGADPEYEILQSAGRVISAREYIINNDTAIRNSTKAPA